MGHTWTSDAPPPGRGALGGAPTRRLLLLVAGAAAPATLAAACGGATSESASGSLQPATVPYLHVDRGQQVGQDNWTQISTPFQARYPPVRLQIDSSTFGQPVIEKAIATFAAGDYYDVLYGHNSFISAWLSADLLQPLDGFLSR